MTLLQDAAESLAGAPGGVYGNAGASRRSPEPLTRGSGTPGAVCRNCRSSLHTRPILDTRVMTVAYAHTDPLLAAVSQTPWLNGSWEPGSNRRSKSLRGASNGSTGLLGSSKRKSEHAEQALADYTRRHSIYGLESKSTPTPRNYTSARSGYASRNGSYFKRVLARTSAPGKDHFRFRKRLPTRRRRTCKKNSTAVH